MKRHVRALVLEQGIETPAQFTERLNKELERLENKYSTIYDRPVAIPTCNGATGNMQVLIQYAYEDEKPTDIMIEGLVNKIADQLPYTDRQTVLEAKVILRREILNFLASNSSDN